MLRDHGMSGTFYTPIEPFNGNPSLTPEHMRAMTAEGFEIGGHGIAHEIMSQIPIKKAREVVRSCKATLEDTLGQKIRMFCYPRGKYTSEVAEELQAAGYEAARTVRLLATDTNYGLYDLPTSIQVYPHTRSQYLRNVVTSGKPTRLYDYMTRLKFEDGWTGIGKKLFDRVMEDGGVWHLWGHSWEIDQMGLWDEFREMLTYVSKRNDVLYLNNGDMARKLSVN
jgi:peptidoglycan/xylan/chitin deacetylase (PgdA/CDA1 family)